MKAQHTPGPWQARAGLSRWNVTTCEKPRTFNICAINTDRIEQAANARLIAAAPELLAACEEAIRYVDSKGSEHVNRVPFVSMRAAIAKARGED